MDSLELNNSSEIKQVTGIKVDFVTTDNELGALVIDNIAEDSECKTCFERRIRDDFYLPDNNHVSIPEGFSLSIDVDSNQYNISLEIEQECNSSKIPKLGETVYCIYQDCIIKNKVGYLGKESFITDIDTCTYEDSWEWSYDSFCEKWFYNLEDAKNELLERLNNGLIYVDFDTEVHEAYFEENSDDVYQLEYRDKDDCDDEDAVLDSFMSDGDIERAMKLINQAIESAQCRIYRVKANNGESIAHQEKAKNQEELMNTTIAALSNYARFIKNHRQ